MKDTNEDYWSDYDGLQHAKHQLLSKYLDGWFPILSRFHGRVIYIDCHAGRGRHDTGQEGSPIIALERLLTHQLRPKILDSTEIHFVFFENNPKNYNLLRKEIDNLGTIPINVRVYTFQDDYETDLLKIMDSLRQQGQGIVPSFAFLDPFNFQLSMQLLNRILGFSGCELFINLMYRNVDMAVRNPVHTNNMDTVFGCRDWCKLSDIENPRDRERETIALFSCQLQAKFVTHMNMRGANGALKYVLIHASNHPKGRNLMKDSMWAVTPDGSFTAHERENPEQLVLIEPEPDFKLLKDMLWKHFAGTKVRMKKINDWSLPTLYREKHVQDIIRDYRKRNIIDATGYSGRFGVKKNPLVSFPTRRPEDS